MTQRARHSKGTPASTPQDADAGEVRLVWAAGSNPSSGAWWPRSHDAVAELRTLLPLVSDQTGRSVTRVSLNIDAWDAHQPRRLGVGDSIVRLGWFRTLDPATVTIARGSGARVTLQVVSPELEPEAARDLLRAASGSAA